jgi:hypothetical protein
MPHTNHLFPGDFGVGVTGLLRNTAGGFANYLKGSYHGILMELTLSEFLPDHIF